MNGNGHTSPSHSNIVSSAVDGASEFSQNSPAKQQEKGTVHLANNGIVMQSDGLSVDELANLQKHIEESLRSQVQFCYFAFLTTFFRVLILLFYQT